MLENVEGNLYIANGANFETENILGNLAEKHSKVLNKKLW